MSAIAAFVGGGAGHMMTDALSYVGAIPNAVDCHKAIVLKGMRAALSCTGPGGLAADIAARLAQRFASFDDLVAAGAGELRDEFLRHAAVYRDGDAVAMAALLGWHEAADRPGLYVMQMETEGERAAWVRSVDPHQGAMTSPPFELLPQELFATPCPTLDQFQAAEFDLLADLDTVDPETFLLHQLEIQRRILIEGRSYVGVHALLTSINAAGVTQRMVHRWDEDQVGEPIRPRPIDWPAWRARRSVAAAAIPTGLSRLQRERMEKKARKGTPRA